VTDTTPVPAEIENKYCSKDGCTEPATHAVSFAKELIEVQPMCGEHAIRYLDRDDSVVKRIEQ